MTRTENGHHQTGQTLLGMEIMKDVENTIMTLNPLTELMIIIEMGEILATQTQRGGFIDE